MPHITPQNSAGLIARAICIPDTPDWKAVVSGLLVTLTSEASWQQVSGITPAEAAAVATDILYSWIDETCVCEQGVMPVLNYFQSADWNEPSTYGGILYTTPTALLVFKTDVETNADIQVSETNDYVLLPAGTYAIDAWHTFSNALTADMWVRTDIEGWVVETLPVNVKCQANLTVVGRVSCVITLEYPGNVYIMAQRTSGTQGSANLGNYVDIPGGWFGGVRITWLGESA